MVEQRHGIDIAHLVRPFPPDAIHERRGAGGKVFSYLDFSAVVNRLNDATQYQWDFRILREEWVGDVLMVTGEMTIPGLGTRAAVGVQKYAPNSGEDLLKGAASDCLKKCASLFGVGLFTCDDRYEERQPAPEPAKNGADIAAVPVTKQTCEKLYAKAIALGYAPSDVDRRVMDLHGPLFTDLPSCTEKMARDLWPDIASWPPRPSQKDLIGAVEEKRREAVNRTAHSA